MKDNKMMNHITEASVLLMTRVPFVRGGPKPPG